jgi:hypothetical protein
MAEVILASGQAAEVDKKDFWTVACHAWHLHQKKGRRTRYAAALFKKKTILMHRFILGIESLPRRVQIDHINGNGLDNRRCNLRIVDQRHQSMNVPPQRNKAVPFKGVSRKRGKFQASIRVDYRSIYLGTFESAEDAARAYDEAARKHFGEYAYTNFSEG